MKKKSSGALLAVDIGNTRTTFAVFQGNKIVQTFYFATALKPASLEKEFLKAMKSEKGNPPVTRAVVCSVVPPILGRVVAMLKKNFGITPSVVGKDVLVPIVNRYRNPRQVGQDRLVCAYAALELYGAPAIVIDFGTAITFDVVSRKKEYLGGIIVPGIRLSAESLFQKTALLPRIDIAKPGALVGRDTRESILSGLFYGYGTMSRGLIRLIARQVRGNPKIIVTGGHTALMKPFIAPDADVIDKYLVLRGLALLKA